MCPEISKQQFKKMESNKKIVSHKIKKLLKQLFKQQKSQNYTLHQHLQNSTKAESVESLESLESLENCHNSNIELECVSRESRENDIRERLTFQETHVIDEFDFSDINAATVPVHFIHTEEGTFFWTASNDIPADNDLVEPTNYLCYNQMACMQDRWAQA